jgi:hypothetical protein
MLKMAIGALTAAASLSGLISLTPEAIGQTTNTQPPATNESPAGAQSGTTSGPASGSPTTLGTTGTTTGTPHQLEGVEDQSSSVKREVEQGGQSGSTQAPHSTGTGQPGSPGTESGPSPAK